MLFRAIPVLVFLNVAIAQTTLFPLNDVRLAPGPFKAAQEKDAEYLLSLEPDRLLAFMREAAGLERKADPYGGWERGASGMIGHYLSACSDMFAATGDERFKDRVDEIVDQMAECQAQDACLYANAWERNHWFRLLGEGKVDMVNVLPFYVMHKTLGGLRDAWKVAGNEKARDVLVRMVDRIDELTAKVTPEQWAEMTTKEFGAPAESIVDVYEFTKNPRHLELAQKFTKRDQLEALAGGDDRIVFGKHANTILPLFTGYERVAQAGSDGPWHEAAENFWGKVIANQTFVFGGNSIWEAFIDPAQFNGKIVEVCGPETCNTYNFLKLTQALYRRDPQVRYADYVERALFNHILSSQGPEGGFVYYTPVRPGHYRRFSKPFDAFWCCVGTGMENHGRYGGFIYAAQPGRLMVNQFIPSDLRWSEERILVRQRTNFPDDDRVALEFEVPDGPREFTVSIRVPDWVEASRVQFRLNGQPVRVPGRPGEYADVTRKWRNGDRLEVELPARLIAELTPAGGRYASFRYGPIVLAARCGTKDLAEEDFWADGSEAFIQLGRKEIPEDDVPKISGDREALERGLRRVPGSRLAFRTNGVGMPGDFELVPFSEIGNERYSVYFPIVER